MFSPLWQLAIAAALASGLMLGLWWLARRWNHVSVVDVGWSAAVGLVAVWFAVSGDGNLVRRAMIGGMLGLWSLRLGSYLLVNRVIGKPEDRRYVALRSSWGPRAMRNFFWFFQAQAALAVLFALPAWVIARMPEPPTRIVDLLGLAVWWLAVTCESAADRQLARFRADPANKGRACRQGWWRYSRHPNYFFEFVHWWSYALLAWSAPQWWITLLLPWIMLWFLLRVTGVKPTEAAAAQSRGSDYAEYQRTTSAFIPWWPKKSHEAQT